MKSIAIALFAFFSFSTAFAATGDSKVTRIEGASLICSDHTGFMAFNFSNSRIWLAEGSFQPNQRGIELDTPRLQKENNVVSFSGSVKISWGNDVYQNVIIGRIPLDKKPLQATVTMTTSTGAQGKTKVLNCR